MTDRFVGDIKLHDALEYVYAALWEYVNPLSSARAKILAQGFYKKLPNSFNHTLPADWARELWKDSKYPVKLVPSIKKIGKFWIWGCLEGDILSGSIGLSLFDQGYLTHVSNPRGNILFLFMKLANICIFWDLEWPSTVCG